MANTESQMVLKEVFFMMTFPIEFCGQADQRGPVLSNPHPLFPGRIDLGKKHPVVDHRHLVAGRVSTVIAAIELVPPSRILGIENQIPSSFRVFSTDCLIRARSQREPSCVPS